MPRITSIKQQGSKSRVSVYLDGKYGFGMGFYNFVKAGLKVGITIGEEEILDLIRGDEFQKRLDKLIAFAMLRPRSEKEAQMWLVRKKVPEGMRENLLEKLRKLELLGDRQFARWWVEQRVAFRPKPRSILRQELRIKGIERDVIEDVLGEVEIDEVKIAKELLEKNEHRWSNLEERKKRERRISFLKGRGFGWESIRFIDYGRDKK